MPARWMVLEELGDALAAVSPGRPFRVGIDGVDGAGKTLLAEEVAQLLTARGRPAVRISLDQFERPMEERYARGELSPEGYYLDAFDLDRFREHVRTVEAPVLVCDGVFLQRPELRDLWDVTIFVECDLEVAAKRGAERNLVWFDSLDETHERYRVSYLPAQQRYLAEQRPRKRADLVFHNTEVKMPSLERQPKEPIVLADYDPAWPAEFEELRKRAAAAVGELAVAIEHVGSTAVPGLIAKPVVDMVVVVQPSDVDAAVERLVAIGYEHEGDLGIEGREAFAWPSGERRHHLYVSPTDSEELRAQLAFRDRLRTDPDVAAEYAALKRKLAERFRNDRPAYTDAKTDFVERYSR